jgi:branched-chain amino acid transport system ATP-binding protein
LLRLDQIHARYARRTILHGVSLQLAAGEIVALLGPNGAGKSTVLKAVFGLATIESGCISLAGEDITGDSPAAQLQRGVAYLPQGGQVFAPLTVEENLQVAAAQIRPRPDLGEAFQRFPALDTRRRQRAGLLSGGERQQLAMAMALLRRPRLLLVDEPSIGLAPRLALDALRLVAEVSGGLGAGVLLVEQNVALALECAQRAVLLVNGRLVAAATTAAILADPALLAQFTYGLEEPASAQ